MRKEKKIFFLCIFAALLTVPAISQLQSCPVNINFSAGSIASWNAATGLINRTNQSYPAPNNGVTTIPEYSIGLTGIEVITTSTSDPFGGFPTIPVINGYTYGYSIKLGSTATSWDLHSNNSNPGGFGRSITYIVNVPAGPSTVPYTMTYAYAMVLENGTHNSNQQPLFKATLATPGGIISCASPEYYLPTFNDAGGGGGGGGGGGSTGATLDSAAAIANGFSVSPTLFLSHSGQSGNSGTYLQDVWTKGWREVTFDLTAYRGQSVMLTFEADNCVPGAHFAYAYVALRNDCGGLKISGSPVACINSTLQYSIPALANATYSWTVPPGWTIVSGANTNIIDVLVGNNGGTISVQAVNSCANLSNTITVTTSTPTVAGQVSGNNTVCSGSNSTSLNLSGETGNVLSWVSSTNGINWNFIPNTTNTYTAQNLTATTQFAAVIQNGSTCKIDTSTVAIVTVDPNTVGGVVDPSSSFFCAGQSTNSRLSLSGNFGAVMNWQVSTDFINWTNLAPANTDTFYNVNTINTTTYYRAISKSGVCPSQASTPAVLNFVNTPFPSATINPSDVSICFGETVPVNATIFVGTNYTWTPSASLQNQGTGNVNTVPFAINAIGSPPGTMDYVLTVTNAGCPNVLNDTFHVTVNPQIVVFAGNDTAIVAGQPLQLSASVNTPTANQFNWVPGTGLNFTNIPDPVATLGFETGDYIIYKVRATDNIGCYAEDDIKVMIFKTGPDIFVPSAFTPNGDGKNDILKPVCVGISQLNYFRIFNRWGQMVYSTNEMGKGWDGYISGSKQSTGNFVFMAQGIDYTGKVIFKKGNIALIR